MSEEEDTLSALFEEIEVEDEDLETEEETVEGDDTSEPEKDNWEKRYKDEQKFLQESREELKEVRKELKSLREKGDEPETDYFDDEALADSMRDDPAEALKLFKQLRDDVVLTLRERDKALLSEIKSQTPEARELQPVVEQLKEDDDYAAFSDEQLLVIAKKMTADDDSSPTIKRAYRPSASKRPVQKKSKDITKTPMWQLVYGDDFAEDK